MRAKDYRASGMLLALNRGRLTLIRRRRPLLVSRRRPLLILLRGRSLLVSRRRTLLLVRRLLRILALLVLLIGALLLHIALTLAHLPTHRASFLAVLVLLIGVELRHDLATKVPIGLRIAGASLRMGLSLLMNDRLNSLLLVAGEIQVAETLGPAVLELAFAGHGVAVCSRCRRRALLRVGAERHNER